MIRPKQQTKAILLHLPIELLQAFDRAANVFGLSRSEAIRRSLTRDAAYIVEREFTKAREEKQRRIDGYRLWLAEQELRV